ncbi:hypothetical protein NFJ02_37g94750 [Pycnococcus provasolii]
MARSKGKGSSSSSSAVLLKSPVPLSLRSALLNAQTSGSLLGGGSPPLPVPFVILGSLLGNVAHVVPHGSLAFLWTCAGGSSNLMLDPVEVDVMPALLVGSDGSETTQTATSAYIAASFAIPTSKDECCFVAVTNANRAAIWPAVKLSGRQSKMRASPTVAAGVHDAVATNLSAACAFKTGRRVVVIAGDATGALRRLTVSLDAVDDDVAQTSDGRWWPLKADGTDAAAHAAHGGGGGGLIGYVGSWLTKGSTQGSRAQPATSDASPAVWMAAATTPANNHNAANVVLVTAEGAAEGWHVEETGHGATRSWSVALSGEMRRAAAEAAEAGAIDETHVWTVAAVELPGVNDGTSRRVLVVLAASAGGELEGARAQLSLHAVDVFRSGESRLAYVRRLAHGAHVFGAGGVAELRATRIVVAGSSGSGSMQSAPVVVLTPMGVPVLCSGTLHASIAPLAPPPGASSALHWGAVAVAYDDEPAAASYPWTVLSLHSGVVACASPSTSAIDAGSMQEAMPSSSSSLANAVADVHDATASASLASSGSRPLIASVAEAFAEWSDAPSEAARSAAASHASKRLRRALTTSGGVALSLFAQHAADALPKAFGASDADGDADMEVADDDVGSPSSAGAVHSLRLALDALRAKRASAEQYALFLRSAPGVSDAMSQHALAYIAELRAKIAALESLCGYHVRLAEAAAGAPSAALAPRAVSAASTEFNALDTLVLSAAKAVPGGGASAPGGAPSLPPRAAFYANASGALEALARSSAETCRGNSSTEDAIAAARALLFAFEASDAEHMEAAVAAELRVSAPTSGGAVAGMPFGAPERQLLLRWDRRSSFRAAFAALAPALSSAARANVKAMGDSAGGELSSLNRACRDVAERWLAACQAHVACCVLDSDAFGSIEEARHGWAKAKRVGLHAAARVALAQHLCRVEAASGGAAAPANVNDLVAPFLRLSREHAAWDTALACFDYAGDDASIASWLAEERAGGLGSNSTASSSCVPSSDPLEARASVPGALSRLLSPVEAVSAEAVGAESFASHVLRSRRALGRSSWCLGLHGEARHALYDALVAAERISPGGEPPLWVLGVQCEVVDGDVQENLKLRASKASTTAKADRYRAIALICEAMSDNSR